ncbi:MAG: lipoyl synthase [Candidatus Brocadiia bacterium]|jgi:lipoic acid synthetase|nr:lipoyl synthase [Candidatus Brocadiia bacterium]
MKASAKKFPPWIKKRIGDRGAAEPVLRALRELDLATVCQEAHCPNMCECFARGTATFMILGRQCTRRCTFCAVEKGLPTPPDREEPGRVAEAAHRLGLRHVVVTSVTRDDLPDGGSEQFARTVRAVHECCGATVEVLTPDFRGRSEDIDRVVSAGPEVYNHNVETVPRLYAEVRPEADYARSLGQVERVAAGGPIGKSGLMLGLGESQEEVMGVLEDLRRVGCAAVTLGQYLQPSPRHHPVVDFIRPAQFAHYEQAAREMGFDGVASQPFARSSYQAGRMTAEMLAGQE